MKKIKPLEEGKVKSQVKVYDGDAPKTQAPPPGRPPKRCGGYPKDWVKLKPTEKQLERERKQEQLELARNKKRNQLREEGGDKEALLGLWEIFEEPKLKINNMEKRLGKIKNVRFGIAGYQDCQIGIHFELGGNGWGVNDGKSAWDPERVKRTDSTEWTEEDRNKQMNDIMRYISSLLNDAKRVNVHDLVGIPIECTFDGNILREWRILTEVL